MDSRLRIELEVARTDTEPRVVTLSAPPDVSAGSALDVLGAHLGLTGAAGAVQARSLVCGSWIDRTTRLSDVGLLRGERLSVVVGLGPPSAPRPLTRWPEPRRPDGEGRVAINRPPRSVRAEPSLSIPVPTKRQTRTPRRFPLGAMLIPLLIGGLLVVVTRRWEIALFSLFTPVMVLWNHVEERRAHRDELAEYGRTYDEEVSLTVGRIRDVTSEWAGWLNRHHPGPDEVTAIVRDLGPRLWERQPGDPDFLRVRLGRATRRAPVTLRQDEAGALSRQSETADFEAAAAAEDVPAVVDLGRSGSLAVLGTDDDVDRAAAWVAVQLASLHSPADLAMAAALSDADTSGWWRWLPHLPREWAMSPVATDRRAAESLLAAIVEMGRQRRTEDPRGTGRPDAVARLVVFVDDRLRLNPALVNDVIDCRDVGVVTVWLGTDARAVPTAAPYLLDLSGGPANAELVAHRGGARLRLVADLLSRSTALELAGWLAPVTDASDAHLTRTVPERVSLEDLVPDVTSPVAMRERWESAETSRLIAQLGMGADGPVGLDLGAEGSHVLVGGTTGSGKSELLQTMVASVAAAYPPSRVGFLLVDYKGGAAFKDAMHLPHCVGVVTDLDQFLTRRVMQALDAEITRREELLTRGGARDLTELRQLAPDLAPGDLVIVVDEFATLAKEIPEFVEGMVDIAARGRSLGLRLVLATQRPAGVINDRIRANVGVRIALRVNDDADSVDVIGERTAAHVSRTLPGRAYLKVHRELTEFQSAFAGGPVRTGSRAPIEVHDSTFAGAPPAPPPSTGGATSLEAVVESSRRVMRLGRWPAPHVPWLPALPSVVTVADLGESVPSVAAGSVLLGLADLPRRQSRRVVALDLERHQNLLVFGTSRSGKTTVLRTIAAGLIDACGPDEVHVYGMDFAGHGLHLLEGAPQCPGVVGPGDPGRVARLLRRLSATVEQRTRLMASSGATSFADLARTSTTPAPRVVVLLDGYGGATSSLERLDGGRLLERLERLVLEGPAAGVHFVITADRRAAVPSALTSVVTTRLVLRMAERDDYALLGVESALARVADLGPGRGFIQGSTEVQVAVLAGAGPEPEQHALTDLVGRAAARWTTPAPPLGRMPAEVGLGELPPPGSTLVLPIAVGDHEVRPVVVDATERHLLVCGPPRSGKSSTLATVAAAAARADDPAALALFVARRSPVVEAGTWDVGPIDASDQAELTRGIAEVETLLSQGRTVLCLCDDVDSLTEQASTALETLARRARDKPLRLVAAVDNRWALRAYSGLVPELRRSKHAILLAPDVDLDGDLVGVRLKAPLESLSTPGRGYLASAGITELVQIAHLGDGGGNNASPAPAEGTLEIRHANPVKGMS